MLKFMRKVADVRSGLATRAFRLAIDQGDGAAWTALIALLMPKSFARGSDIRVSRRALKAIVQDADPQRVEATLTRLEARAANSAWVVAFAIEYGLLRGDWAFAERFLRPCLTKLLATGAKVPKRYLTLLVGFQVEEGRTDAALQTLTTYAPGGSGGPYARELDLLAASALVEDEAQWLARVNGVFEPHGMGILGLDGAASETKFSRLSAKSTLGDGRPTAAKVTVIVSCFNAEAYLETSLRSLFEQSYANLEIIAVDDMSSDGTWALLTGLAEREPRLRLLRNAKNVGTYVSRNRALRASTGDYVTTQDSDDWSHPDRIWRQVKRLEDHPDAVASYCAGLRMWSDGRFEVHQRTGDVVRRLCYASLMYRKGAILGLTGYWDCVRVDADAEYLHRVLRLCGPRSVLGCPEPLMIQLRRENSLTTLAETKNVQRLRDGPRLAYRAEAARFAKALLPSNARYDFEAWRRPFPAPTSIVVPDELVREAATWE
jgi:hypothetical protein